MSSYTRAVGWMLLSVTCFVGMGTTAKLLSATLHPFEVAFFRASFGLLVVLPAFAREGVHLWITPTWRLQFLRGLFGTLAMGSAFYAVAHLPLAEATAYGYTRPLFVVLLAAVLLGEALLARRILATVVGFLGVLIMLRPTPAGLQPAALVALFGAFCAAMVSVLLRRLVQSARPVVVLAWLGLVGTLLTAPAAAWVWRTPDVRELGLVVLMGTFGTLVQIGLMRAYRLAEAGALVPLDYLRLPVAALVGFVLFGELPDPWAVAGAVLVVASTALLATRERGG